MMFNATCMRASAILLIYMCAPACGGAAFEAQTLEFLDDAGSEAAVGSYLSDANGSSQADSPAQTLDSGSLDVQPSPIDVGGYGDSQDPGGDATSHLDTGTDSGSGPDAEFEASLEAGPPPCCTINHSGGPCSVGEVFHCDASSVSCGASACTFTDPGVGTCGGVVAPCL